MNNSEIGSNAPMADLADVSYAGSVGISRRLFRLRDELRGLLPIGEKKRVSSVQYPHNETAFRFLLANEVKRSKRSGHSFHILLTHLAGSDGCATRIDDRMTGTLVPVLSSLLRETDYIGWYRDRYVLGGVLTALGEHSPDDVSGRIEQRFWWRMGKEFPAQDFARLRVRFLGAEELERFESANSLTLS